MRSRKKRLWSWLAQTVALTILIPSVFTLPEVINIGGIFEATGEQQEQAFKYAIHVINTDRTILPRSELMAQYTNVAPHDSFRALKNGCKLFEGGIAALFGPSSPSTAGTLQSACDQLHVPYIETHWDYSRLDRTHLISMFPDGNILAMAFYKFIEHYHWTTFTIIYEDNEALIRLKELIKIPTDLHMKVTLRQVKEDHDFKKLMKDMKKLRVFHFVVDLPLHKVQRLFLEAHSVDMMTGYQSYLLTSLDIETVDWLPEIVRHSNVSGFRIVDPTTKDFNRVLKDWRFEEDRHGRLIKSKQPILTETALIYDGMMVLARALQDLDNSQTIDLKSLYCQGSSQWHHGSSIVNYMKMLPRQGLSGEIKLDIHGQRTTFAADLIKLSAKGLPEKIGRYESPAHLELFSEGAGDIADAKERIKNQTLRVSTIISEPYVMEKIGGKNLKGNDKYEGFCVDVMEELSKKFQFHFEIIPVIPKAYGDNSTADGEWDGMIGKLLKREADVAIADLTITYKRESVVDFTLPFMQLGISILFKKPSRDPPNLFSFLDPMSLEVWFFMATAFLGVSLLLYITARLTPYEWVNPHPCDIETDTLENQFTLVNSFWFVIGSIMQQGSDILPRAVSTRIIASSWWFFTLIMISSYTANLAAFLTAQRMTSPITGAVDLSKQTKIEYGCVKGGSTMNFFNDSTYPTYKRMWTFMESRGASAFVSTNSEGIERVKRGNYAFLMESTSIDYVIQSSCELFRVGGELDSKGYGIATVPGSPYTNLLSSGVLELQEKGRFQVLREKWWRGQECGDDAAAKSDEMGVRNVAGVFLVVFVGVFLGIAIVIVEFSWKAKKQMDRGNIALMLWREFRDVVTGRGSTRPIPKEPDEPSVEKMPMVNLRTNPATDTDMFS